MFSDSRQPYILSGQWGHDEQWGHGDQWGHDEQWEHGEQWGYGDQGEHGGQWGHGGQWTDLVMAVRILDKDITQVVDITQIVQVPRLSSRVLFLTREGRDGE